MWRGWVMTNITMFLRGGARSDSWSGVRLLKHQARVFTPCSCHSVLGSSVMQVPKRCSGYLLWSLFSVLLHPFQAALSLGPVHGLILSSVLFHFLRALFSRTLWLPGLGFSFKIELDVQLWGVWSLDSLQLLMPSGPTSVFQMKLCSSWAVTSQLLSTEVLGPGRFYLIKRCSTAPHCVGKTWSDLCGDLIFSPSHPAFYPLPFYFSQALNHPFSSHNTINLLHS